MADNSANIAYSQNERFSIADTLKGVVQAFKRNPATLFALTIVFGILPLIVWGLFVGNYAQDFEGDAQFGFLGATAIAGIINLVSYLIVQAALVQASYRSLKGDRAAFGESVSSAARVVLPLFVLFFLFSFAILFGFVLFVIPGIILAVMWSVSVPSLVLERTGVIGAFGRSRQLTKGHRWSIFGMFLLIIVLAVIISGILMALVLFSGSVALDGMGTASTIAIVVDAIISGLTNAVGAVLVTSLFVQLREVHEGPESQELEEIFA